jgi:hypothetical protein
MRHAWGTIHERLGLRPSAPSPEQGTRNIDVPQPTTAPTAAATATEPAAPISLPDTRDLMLAEMTRVFNGGFGLGAHRIAGTPAFNNQESSGSRTPSLATLHLKAVLTGSDRFLMDLQIDLRTALTQAEDLPLNAPTDQGRRSMPKYDSYFLAFKTERRIGK